MVIKYYTHQNPPQIMGETFTEPSLTRESDYVSLEHLFERFCLSGLKSQVFKGASDMTDEEKEQLLAETDIADLQEMDLLEQRAFADSVLQKVLSEQDTLRTEKAVANKLNKAESNKPELDDDGGNADVEVPKA